MNLSKRSSLEISIRECLENDPVKYSKISSIYNHTNTIGNIDLDLNVGPFFNQTFKYHGDSIENKILCGLLWQYILNENLKYIIQETPQCFCDNKIKENDELVKSYITNVKNSDIIEACFCGGNQDEDGYIKFKNPPIDKCTSFPLEIGYCDIKQFYFDLMQYHCIARLPYNSDHIVYFEFKLI